MIFRLNGQSYNVQCWLADESITFSEVDANRQEKAREKLLALMSFSLAIHFKSVNRNESKSLLTASHDRVMTAATGCDLKLLAGNYSKVQVAFALAFQSMMQRMRFPMPGGILSLKCVEFIHAFILFARVNCSLSDKRRLPKIHFLWLGLRDESKGASFCSAKPKAFALSTEIRDSCFIKSFSLKCFASN